MSHLASFHAYLLCLDEESSNKWKDRYRKCPINPSAFDVFARKAEKLLEIDKARFQAPFHRLKRDIMEMDFLHYVTEGCLEELSLPVLLIHGDFHTHNIMWKTAGQEGGELSDELAAILNWQVVHKGKTE